MRTQCSGGRCVGTWRTETERDAMKYGDGRASRMIRTDMPEETGITSAKSHLDRIFAGYLYNLY